MDELTIDLHESIDIALQMSFHNCIQTNNHFKTAIPYLIGPPGGGKSASLNASCQKYKKVGFISIHFAFKPLEDISGLPYAEKITINGTELTGTRWSLPQLITIFYAQSQLYDYLIILIDDYHLCSKDHQNLGYELFTEHSLRGVYLPQNSAIILAGNDSTLSNSIRLSSGISNRVFMMFVVTNYDHWKFEYAIPNNIRPEILSFLNNKINQRKYFHEDENIKSYASPRTWSYLSIAWDLLEKNSNLKLHHICQGHIGIKASSAFMAHCKIFNTINCEKIFQTGKFNIPQSSIDGYIFGTAIISYYIQNLKKNNDTNRKILCQIIDELCKYHKEIAIAIMKEFNLSLNTYYSKFKSEYNKIMNNIDSQNRDNIIKTVIELKNNL